MTRDACKCSDTTCDASPLFVALLDGFGRLVRGLNGSFSVRKSKVALLPLFSLRWDREVSGALHGPSVGAGSGAGRLYRLFERTLLDISLMCFAIKSSRHLPLSPLGVLLVVPLGRNGV